MPSEAHRSGNIEEASNNPRRVATLLLLGAQGRNKLRFGNIASASTRMMGRRATFLSDEKPRHVEGTPPKHDNLVPTPQQQLKQTSLFRAASQWVLICLTMVMGLTFLLELLDGKASLLMTRYLYVPLHLI